MLFGLGLAEEDSCAGDQEQGCRGDRPSECEAGGGAGSNGWGGRSRGAGWGCGSTEVGDAGQNSVADILFAFVVAGENQFNLGFAFIGLIVPFVQ